MISGILDLDGPELSLDPCPERQEVILPPASRGGSRGHRGDWARQPRPDLGHADHPGPEVPGVDIVHHPQHHGHQHQPTQSSGRAG